MNGRMKVKFNSIEFHSIPHWTSNSVAYWMPIQYNTKIDRSKMNWFPNYSNCLFPEEPYPQQRDDINAELSNSSESIFLRKFDRFQLQHQPYPVMMQRDHRLPLSSRNVRMPAHENSHLVKSQSLSPLESMNNAQQMPKANYTVNDAMYLARSRSTSLTLKPNTTIVHHITSKTGEDSSQSSLNLSASSGYLSGSSSANSSNLNLSGRSSSSSTYVLKFNQILFTK